MAAPSLNDEATGRQALHQELYVIGRDIVSKHGNLLVEYGCRVVASPIPSIPSLYSKSWNRRSRLSLRGFGVFIGDDSLGGIFVHRYTFEPRWMPAATFDPIAWLPSDMPRTRKPRNQHERYATSLLFARMVDWFIEYETWISDNFDPHYRTGQLTHFPAEKKETVYWNLLQVWKGLRNDFEC